MDTGTDCPLYQDYRFNHEAIQCLYTLLTNRTKKSLFWVLTVELNALGICYSQESMGMI